MSKVVLHATGPRTGLMVTEFRLPDDDQADPNARKSLFLVCWNGVWCSPTDHPTLSAALAELTRCEGLLRFIEAPRGRSAMSVPSWQKQSPWRRIRPLLHIAGWLTLPPIPGQRTRAQFSHASACRTCGRAHPALTHAQTTVLPLM